MAWASVEAAVAAFGRGEPLLVADSRDRKNECDLVFSAEQTDTKQMAFAIRHSTGIVYVAAEAGRLQHFGLYPASTVSAERPGANAELRLEGRAYVSTTYLPGSSTGLSAADRAATARALCNRKNPPEAFSKPGHMFPVAANPGGVLERPGHTEAAYDLCRLSGRVPVACISELTNDDGTMLTPEDGLEFARRHGILAVSVEQIMQYRLANPSFPNGPNPDKAPSIRGLDLPTFDGKGLKIAIVSARWNAVVCEALIAGAKQSLTSCGVTDITVEYVAGSYEIPAAAQVILETGQFDGLICIGCLIKGETMHFEYINEAVTQAVMRLNLDYKVPVIYGVLSTLNEDQAKARSGVDGAGHNSGVDWGITCVESCLLKKRYGRLARARL